MQLLVVQEIFHWQQEPVLARVLVVNQMRISDFIGYCNFFTVAYKTKICISNVYKCN